ncbi:hypothetical protein WJX75_009296 [Coccomyxa subellipsoidea]|uniref:intramembrane prenyl-peptidase Rce1 n=1 Tax=Coccomyxa subellipsoidea TaxID=248742 RepID=A0ABR2Z5Y7_9CHLO
MEQTDANGIRSTWVDKVLENSVLGALTTLLKVLLVPIQLLSVLAQHILRDILMGPLTEEFAFRSCMAPLLLLQGLSAGLTILVTPLFFGLAHGHHLYEYVVHQRQSLKTALFAVAFQFGFTTMFGWFATFVFLRTGHLAAAAASPSTSNNTSKVEKVIITYSGDELYEKTSIGDKWDPGTWTLDPGP